jgi:alpha-beta hydrolase superfamily lysophospholipase
MASVRSGGSRTWTPARGAHIGRVNAADGTALATRHWRTPPDAVPWAHLLLVHGLGEHSGRYEHVGGRLADAGIDVRAYDQRGFGASGGRRAWVERWSQFHDDLAERLAETRSAAGDRPVVLYGHSAGGLVCLGYVLSPPPDRPMPDLLVLSAPAVDSTLPAWKKAAARVLGRFLPTLSIRNALNMESLSRDPDVGRRYLADPLNHHRTTSFGLAGLLEQERVRGEFASLGLPTLVLHGAADRLVPTVSSEPLGDLPGVTRRTFPWLRHEIHNEEGWEAVVDGVIVWLRERTPAGPGVESPDN